LSSGGNSVESIALLPAIICNPQNLSRYIDLSPNNVIHLNVSIEEISEKLCGLTKSTSQLLDLTAIVLEELDLETFVHLVSFRNKHFIE
jgi:hypothetical protein